MKVRINKYDGGGLIQSSFAVDQPTMSPYMGGGRQYMGQKQETLGDVDALKDLLTKGGLTSDVRSFVSELGNIDLSGNNLNGNTAMTLHLIDKVNEIKNNRDMWNDAVTSAKANGSYSEVAIGQSGELFYKGDNGQIDTASVEEVKKDPSKYTGRIMTIADLLYERQQNLPFNRSVFNIAQDSIGMDKITDHVQKLFQTLSEYSNTSQRTYSKEDLKRSLEAENQVIQQGGRKPTEEEIQSIQSLTNLLNTPGDYVKEESKYSAKGKNPKAALQYIWNTLGDVAKKKLTTVAALNGQNGLSLVADMLDNYVGGSREDIITPEKKSSVGDISTKDIEKPLNTYQLFHKDALRTPDMTFTFNDPKLNVLFRGTVGSVGPLLTPDGNQVPMANMSQILSTGLGQVVKGDDMYFGNKKVDPGDQQNLVYDGRDVAKVYMPVGKDGAPDFEALKTFKELSTVFEANKDTWSIQKLQDLFKNAGYNLTIDEKYEGGKVVRVIRDNSTVKPFLVVYGYTNDSTDLVNTDSNPWITKLSSQEENNIVPRLQQVWTVGKGKDSKNMTPNKFWNINDYYKGIITMPYRKDATAIVDAQVGQGPLERQQSISDVQRNLLNSTQPGVIGSGSAMALVNNK